MTDTIMENPPLSPDTEAILLLCGRFGSGHGEQASPLTQKEYEALARWLLERKLRPADLLNANSSLLAELVQAKLDHARVGALLRRGTALALAMEKWRRSGLWILSRSDSAYPKRLKRKLGQSAPPLLYGAGDASLLDNGGVAIVGSRDVSESGLSFTRDLAQACVRDGMGVVSGGAKGVDAAAMQACGEAGGIVIGVLAADLLRSTVNRQNRQGIQSGQLVLISPFNPEAGFNAGNAMARNRYIYALADLAVVVDSAEGEGGTWAGAIEDLRHEWTPLYVRDPGDKPGNRALIAKGAIAFTYDFSERTSIREFLENPSLSATSSMFEKPLVNKEANTTTDQAILLKNTTVSVATNEPEKDRANAASASVDLFQDFLSKISSLLEEGSKSEEEIREALNIEKSQAKTWLALAVKQKYIEKHKKPVSYFLSRQKLLC